LAQFHREQHFADASDVDVRRVTRQTLKLGQRHLPCAARGS